MYTVPIMIQMQHTIVLKHCYNIGHKIIIKWRRNKILESHVQLLLAEWDAFSSIQKDFWKLRRVPGCACRRQLGSIWYLHHLGTSSKRI